MDKNYILKLPDGVFLQWYCTITHPWWCPSNPNGLHNVDEEGKVIVKFVAVKNAWWFKIYHSMDSNFTSADYFDSQDHLNVSYESILRGWASLRDPATIISIFWSKDVMDIYRN